VAGGLELPGPTRRVLEFPEEPSAWHVSGRKLLEAPPGELRVAGGPPAEGGKGEDVLFELPGPFQTRAFNQVAVTGVFPAVFEVLLQLDGGPKPFRHPALTTPRQDSPQTLLFDLEALRGRQLSFERMRIMVRGPRRPFTLQGIDLIDLPGHQLLPSLADAPALVDLTQESRQAQGLPPGIEAACTFEVEHEADRLSFAAGLPPRLRPAGGSPRLEVRLEGSGGGRAEQTLALTGDRPVWHEARIDLSGFVGQTVTARFNYRCEAAPPGIAAVGDLRVWRRGSVAPTTVLVSSDTHRADHVAAMGLGVELDTPSLDALAASGLLFERAWATTNVTSPSHVAMLTAIHPRDTRLVSNQDRLAEEAETIAEAYQAAGWRTLLVVSVRHLGPRGTNLGQGFDQVLAPTSSPWSAEVALETLERWIEEADGLPVFAFLHLFDAHHPYEPPPSHDRRYYPADRDPFDASQPAIEARRGSMPMDYWGRLRDVEFPKAQYRAEVTYLDGVLGRLFARPRVAEGLIAFTSDHGEILEKAGSYFNHGELYPDTLHVPLVLGGAALPPEFRGTRAELLVSQLDLGRTLLDLSGLGGADLPGRNLLQQVTEGSTGPLFALSAHGLSASITDGDWFLLLHLKDHQGTHAVPRKRHQVELFDLAADPDCLHDLAAEQPAQTAELREALIAWLDAASPAGLSKRRTSSAEELASLKAMGYATEEAVIEAEAWYEPE